MEMIFWSNHHFTRFMSIAELQVLSLATRERAMPAEARCALFVSAQLDLFNKAH